MEIDANGSTLPMAAMSTGTSFLPLSRPRPARRRRPPAAATTTAACRRTAGRRSVVAAGRGHDGRARAHAIGKDASSHEVSSRQGRVVGNGTHIGIRSDIGRHLRGSTSFDVSLRNPHSGSGGSGGSGGSSRSVGQVGRVGRSRTLRNADFELRIPRRRNPQLSTIRNPQ